jgi:WNK lysine deficient protein kinase
MDPFLIVANASSYFYVATTPSPPSDDDDVPPLAFTSSNVSDDTLPDDHHQEEAADEPPAIARGDMMTITGKLNAEEDAIFLKVQITDEAGHARNIYIPFDTSSDTAMEVATSPSGIAAIIEQEIHKLLPDREQHEYSYAAHNDDDENEDQPPPPFYYLSSSPTSSQGSPSSGPHGGGLSKGKHTCSLVFLTKLKLLHHGKQTLQKHTSHNV